MAITSLAGVRAGLQPAVYFVKNSPSPNFGAGVPLYATQWAKTGNPLAGSYSSTLAGAALTGPVTGQLNFNNPPSGNCYLARFEVQSNAFNNAIGQDNSTLLCDRLWHNGGIDVTSTAAQTVGSPTWPARDVAGSTNGDGVLIMLETSVLCVGANTPNFTLSYTNSAGTSGRTAKLIRGTAVATPPVGVSWPFELQAGDTGVQSIQSVTLDAAWTSGTVNLVAYRPIAFAHTPKPNGDAAVDAITGGLPILYANSVLFFYSLYQVNTNNNQSSLVGNVQYTFG